jgi:NifU-like protein involved in Fe-S cluster formation
VNYNDATMRCFEGAAAAAGVLSGAGVCRGSAGRRAQGTWVQFDLQPDAGVIQSARFLAFGCPHTIAVSAWVAEHAVGLPLTAALPENVQQLSERFAVPIEKRGRLLIIEDAWVAAVRCGIPAIESPPGTPI